MRSGVWLWALVALPCGCSGGYPLPPTRCDDWCDATKGLMCEYYSPASCVSECEQQELDLEVCRGALDAVLACFRGTPGAADDQCSYYGYDPTNPYSRPCDLESSALGICADNNRQHPLFGQVSQRPTPEQPTPEQPTPEQPTPEQPTPEQPTPEQPTPEPTPRE